MPSPLDHVDAASFFGSWPLTPYFSGATPAVLPGALLDRATLLSARRESDAGFNVSGRSFKIWIDAVGPITVTFTGTNPLDLDDVITQINSGVLGGYGQDVAFRDNGFLRLRSATIGGTSYLKVDTDSASSPADVFFELGLFAGLESYGGRLTTSPTVDPDRQAALPGQYSVSYGEDLNYDAINRAICQLAVNADHAYGQFRRGMAKTTTADLAVSSDEVQITGENVYCGKITAGTAQDDTAVVLDTNDNEVLTERAVDLDTGLDLDFWYDPDAQKQYVDCTTSVFDSGDSAGDFYVVVSGVGFGSLNQLKILEYVSATRAVVMNVVEADGTEVEVGTQASPVNTTSGIRRRIDTDRLYITDFLDGPGGSSVINTAVEIVAATAISRVEWNNRLVCDSATFSANGVKEGDVAVIASHGTSVPFSNNGSYRVSKVIDEKTIELMGLDHGPILLNTLGALGTVTIQTDTNFFSEPYAKLSFAPPSGTYRIVFKKYASLLEMVDDIDSFTTSPTRFIQETSTAIQRAVKDILGPSVTAFSDTLYGDKRNSLENLYFRVNQEHNADGRHTSIRPDEIHVLGETGTLIRSWGPTSNHPEIDSLIPGSNSGSLIEGTSDTHLVMGIRDNQVDDTFSIVSGGGDFHTDSLYDTLVASFRADGYTYLKGPVGFGGDHLAQSLIHTHRGDYGGGGPDSATSITIEDDTTAYLSFLTPSTTGAGLLFGDEASNARGSFIYDHGVLATDEFRWSVSGANRMRLDAGSLKPFSASLMDLGAASERWVVTYSDYLNVGTGAFSSATTADFRRLSSADLTQQALRVYHDITGSSTGALATGLLYTAVHTTGTVLDCRGVMSRLEKSEAGDISNYRGIWSYATTADAGDITDFTHFAAEGVFGHTGNIDNFYGLNVATPGGSGTITTLYGIRIAPQTRGSTSNYGLYIGGASGGSSLNYSIWVDSGNSRFDGDIEAYHIYPRTTQTYDLGGDSLRWRRLWITAGNTPGDITVGGRTYQSGIWAQHSSGRDTLTISPLNDFLNDTSTSSAVAVIHPYADDSLKNDSQTWAAFRVSHGATLVDSFHVSIRGRVYAAGPVGIGGDKDEQLHVTDSADVHVKLTSTEDITTSGIYLGGIKWEGRRGALYHPAAAIRVRSLGATWSAATLNNASSALDFYTQDGTATDATLEGTPKMTLDSLGRLGVGIAAPIAQMHVRSAATAVTVLGANYSDLCVEGTGNSGITVITPSGGNGGLVFTDIDNTFRGFMTYEHDVADQDLLKFGTLGSTWMVIDWLGRVGIGTTPDANTIFHVQKSVVGSPPGGVTATLEHNGNCVLDILSANGTDNFGAVWFGDADSGATGRIEYHQDDNHLEIWTGNAPHVYVSSTGSVGIGSDAFGAKLDVVGDIAASTGFTGRSASAGITLAGGDSISDGSRISLYGSSHATLAGDAYYLANEHTFRTLAGSPLLRIENTTGQVGVGTESPSRLLHVQESSVGASDPDTVCMLEKNDSAFLSILSSNLVAKWAGIHFGDAASSSIGRIQYYHFTNRMEFWTNGTQKINIDSSGNMTPNGTGIDLGAASASSTWDNVYCEVTRTYDTSQDPGGQAGLLKRNQQNLIVARCRINITTPTSPSISGDHWNVASVARLTEGSFEVTLDQSVDTNSQVMANPDLGVVNGFAYLVKASLTAGNKVRIHTYSIGMGSVGGTVGTAGGVAYIALDDANIDYLDLIVVGRPSTLQ